QVDGDRVEEDHLDVEEDEQHRDQVEADPELEAPLDVRGQAALVRRGLRLARPRRAEEPVERREGDPDRRAEPEEHQHWEVATEQRKGLKRRSIREWRVLYTTLVTMCYIVLSVAISLLMRD